MIKKINIKDFAIIDDINIDFNPGLTVITGETGSGKSIILEAISSLINYFLTVPASFLSPGY